MADMRDILWEIKSLPPINQAQWPSMEGGMVDQSHHPIGHSNQDLLEETVRHVPQ